MAKDLKWLTDTTIEYFDSKGLELPSTVTEYMQDFAPGCSRQMIKQYTGLTCGGFLTHIGSKYEPTRPAIESLDYYCNKFDLTALNINRNSFRAKNRIVVKCNQCGYENNTTLDSLRGTIKGCRKCKSGNLAWENRREELTKIILDRLDGTLEGGIPPRQSGFITIRCNKCYTEYKAQIIGVVHPNSDLRATCPNCRETDRRIVVDGVTFGSKFEYECYQLLEHLEPELHIKYKDHFDTTRRWLCDFKIGNQWVEVSNFKTDYKNYFENIENKRNLVENNGGVFFFLRSIPEVESFVKEHHN